MNPIVAEDHVFLGRTPFRTAPIDRRIAVMSGFKGGSAWTMARDISEGFVNLTDRTFRSVPDAQIAQLRHEIDRLLRELRGAVTVDEERPALQARQRRIQRLNSAMMMIRGDLERRRRP